MRDSWKLWDSAFSADFCNDVINKGRERELTPGTVFSEKDYKAVESIRKSNVTWMEDPDIKLSVLKYVFLANETFNFDIDLLPGLQFTEYVEGSYYNLHHDVDYNSDSPQDRKLSISVQLSDPYSYEGGDLVLTSSTRPATQDLRKQGSILVFPRYLQHFVNNVTTGTRYSLVGWVEGPRCR